MKFIRYQTSTPQLPTFHHGALLNEIDRLFELGLSTTSRGESGAYGFPVDVYQDADAVVVRSELPGFRKEDLQVQVVDDTLTIKGDFASEAKDGKAVSTAHMVERVIALPENLDREKVSASYENGVLTVRLPKREEVKPTTVAIEVK
jgi:HSP20 family protein